MDFGTAFGIVFVFALAILALYALFYAVIFTGAAVIWLVGWVISKVTGKEF